MLQSIKKFPCRDDDNCLKIKNLASLRLSVNRECDAWSGSGTKKVETQVLRLHLLVVG